MSEIQLERAEQYWMRTNEVGRVDLVYVRRETLASPKGIWETFYDQRLETGGKLLRIKIRADSSRITPDGQLIQLAGFQEGYFISEIVDGIPKGEKLRSWMQEVERIKTERLTRAEKDSARLDN